MGKKFAHKPILDRFETFILQITFQIRNYVN